MPSFSSTSSADQWKEEVKAEQILARIDLLEDLAELSEEHECAKIRKRLAERYRAVVGVDPAKRGEIAAAMESIKAGDCMTVEEVLHGH